MQSWIIIEQVNSYNERQANELGPSIGIQRKRARERAMLKPDKVNETVVAAKFEGGMLI